MNTKEVRMYLRTVGLGGLGRMLMGKAFGTSGLMQVRRRDCAHPLFLRVPSSDVSVYKQVFNDREYDFRVKDAPRTIIDAGANIGFATVWFANRYPAARIIALEPERSNFEVLTKNVGPYANVTPVHGALWHRTEEISLVDPGLGQWGFMTEGKDQAGSLGAASRHLVQAYTVDALMQQHGIDSIDLLKVDIEGAEKEVFADPSAWISKVDSLVTELHEPMKAGCNRSFYRGTEGFAQEWLQGENVCLSRGGCLIKAS